MNLLVALFIGKCIFIGDSHSNSFRGLGEVIWVGPVLMNTIGRDGFPDFMVDYLNETNARKFFVFGEIDVRCHLAKGYDIEDLVNRYTNALKDFNKVGIVSVCPPTPRALADTLEHPVLGTDEQRKEWTLEVNRLLKKKCEEMGWTFLDVWEPYQKNGFLNPKYSDGTVHIKDKKGLFKLLYD